MPGAELGFLHRDRRALAQRMLKLFAPMPRNHDLPLGRQVGGALQQMLQHRSSGDRMKHFVQIALHAHALAGGEGDDG